MRANIDREDAPQQATGPAKKAGFLQNMYKNMNAAGPNGAPQWANVLNKTGAALQGKEPTALPVRGVPQKTPQKNQPIPTEAAAAQQAQTVPQAPAVAAPQIAPAVAAPLVAPAPVAPVATPAIPAPATVPVRPIGKPMVSAGPAAPQGAM